MSVALAAGVADAGGLGERDSSVNAGLTPREPRRVVETPEYAAFVRRILRACGRRVGDGDVEGLVCLVDLRSELEEAITSAVRGLRSEPWNYSWAQVAAVIGITRQGAQQRYGDGPICEAVERAG